MLRGSEMALFSSIMLYVMISTCQSDSRTYVVIPEGQPHNVTANSQIATFPVWSSQFDINLNFTMTRHSVTSPKYELFRCNDAEDRGTNRYIIIVYARRNRIYSIFNNGANTILSNTETQEGVVVGVKITQRQTSPTNYQIYGTSGSDNRDRKNPKPQVFFNAECFAAADYNPIWATTIHYMNISFTKHEELFEQCYCDFRNKDCKTAKLHKVFQYDATIMCSYPTLNVTNVNVTGSNPNLACDIPVDTSNASFSSYGVTIGVPGFQFDDLYQYYVYDSKCIDCSSATCNGTISCTLKAGTCKIAGKCYLANEASPDDSCKICDPAKDTTMFVDATTPNCTEPVYSKLGDFSLECHELSATATIQKSKLYPNYNNTMMKVSLKHPSCSNILPVDNFDNVTITGTFKQCGTPHKETNTSITQELQVLVAFSEIFNSMVVRNSSYLYTLQCNFDRSLAVSSGNYFSTIDPVETAVNVTSNTVFNAEIDIYTTDSYLVKATSPFQVSSSQPIYIGITESNANEKFKFIVNRCFATPSASTSGSQYTIIDKKCPIDPTLEIVNVSKNIFQFKLEAFRFIEVHRSIYIHCLLYVCPQSANSGRCDQTCSTRSRRSVEENGPLQEISVTSQQITFQKVKTCKDLSCPIDSKCVENYPAECVCRDGLVLNFVEHKCSDKHMFKISGLHLDAEYLYTYADPLSSDFRRLDSWAKKELVPLFRKNGEDIVGVRIIGATFGSIVLDMLLLYAKNVSMERAIEIFTSTVFVSETEKQSVASDSILLKVKQNIAPKVVAMVPYEEKTERKQDNKILVVAVAVSALAIMLALLAVFVSMYRRRNETKSVDGADNQGMDYNERTM